jgi:hypothetical protein
MTCLQPATSLQTAASSVMVLANSENSPVEVRFSAVCTLLVVCKQHKRCLEAGMQAEMQIAVRLAICKQHANSIANNAANSIANNAANSMQTALLIA